MAICNNCYVELGCGCQRRDASDGKSCCEYCVANYELKLLSTTSPKEK
jgi:hypothetical protein